MFQDQLTPAEWKVVEAVRHGLSNPQIARSQGVTLDAVKYHVSNALQKLGFLSRAELKQWDGIARASVLSKARLNTPAELNLGAIGQIGRSVRDVAAARLWYQEVLGLNHLYSFAQLAFFDCNGIRLFIFEAESPDACSIIYFSVDDIHAAHRLLLARGVEFINAPHMIHKHPDGIEEWMAFFKDPESRPLALMSRVAPSEQDSSRPDDVF